MENYNTFIYRPSNISDNVYIEIEEEEGYNIHRCVEMTKEEYLKSQENRYFGDKRNIVQVFYTKKVKIPFQKFGEYL
jgi:hypothetical protein